MVSHQEMLGTAWSWHCSTLAGHVWPSRLKVTLNFCHILPGDRTIVQKIFGLNTTDYDNIIFCLWPTHTIYWPSYCNLIASPEPVCVSQEKIMVSHQ